MQMTEQSHSDLSPKDYWAKLVKRVKDNIIALRFGQKVSIKPTESVVFYRIPPLPVITKPITEQPATASSKTIEPVPVQIKTYTNCISLPEYVNVNSRSPLLDYAMEILADHAQMTIQDEAISELVSGANVLFAGEVSSRNQLSGNQKLTIMDIRRAVAFLQREHIPPFEDGCYVCLIHPDKLLDLFTNVGLAIFRNTESLNTEKGLAVRFAGVRFYETTALPIISNEATHSGFIYLTLVFGKNAYGIVDMDIDILETTDKNIKFKGEEKTIICYEAKFAVKRLDEKAIVRIESN